MAAHHANQCVAKRPDDDTYFMGLAFIVAERSKCLRRKVGAVIVKNKRVLATGYNGPPSGVRHCDEIGCLRSDLNVPSGQRHELCLGLHAEQNAIIQAANQGISIAGARMYVTNRPCSVCAKMIVNAGIVEIIYAQGYDDLLSDFILTEGNVSMRQVGIIP